MDVEFCELFRMFIGILANTLLYVSASIIERIYMQWIAILAALGWSLLQVFILFLSTQCIFGLIEFKSETENKYQKLLSHSIMCLFYSLFILPFISLGLFYYAVINITAWHELEPAICTFAIWWGVLFTFCSLLSVKKSYVQSDKNK